MASNLQDFPFGIMDVVELLHLRVRRRLPDSVYVDCPFCGDRRGKMNVNLRKDNWRCNYCGEGDGMLKLYARMYGITLSDAYREICDAIMNGIVVSSKPLSQESSANTRPVTDSPRAGADVIHATYTAMLDQLLLKKEH